jgi:hypothetical protein
MRLLPLLACLLLAQPQLAAAQVTPGAAAPPLEGVALERVPADDRAELVSVTSDPTVDAEVSGEVRASPRVYRFLLTRLPFAARAIQALELPQAGRYEIEDRGAGRFSIDDTAGAYASCTRPWDEEGNVVVIARGHLDVPVLPRVLGTGVIVTRWGPSSDDPAVLAARCRVLFRLNSRVLHALTAPVRELLARVVEDKLALLVRSATLLAEAVERDPAAVLAAVERAGTASAADLQAFREVLLPH